MRFEVSITMDDEECPFWTKSVPTREDAARVAKKNQRLIDRHQWKHAVAIKEIP